ncbi:MAG: hypothetical protein ABJ251_22370 [Paracoccaceae bacterium]
MRWCFLFPVLLAACDTPGPHFRGITPQTVTVDGSTFDIRVRGKLAKAIRTNAEYAPRLGPIAKRAQVAIEMVSTCQVKEIRGDQAYVIGVLDCAKAPHQAHGHAVSTDYECITIDSFRRSSTNERAFELDCTAI